ncbi:MAG: NAD(P)H-dependent oxidoreductase [Solirubrobacterales bacterium]|nr:NAD(P)H-dependent oxidoreductase [Solirubrobacterales bacterium]
MSRRITVIVGHPAGESFAGSLAASYIEGAEAAGNEVRVVNLAEIEFDPILRTGYAGKQPLEPDLVVAQEAISWAEHIVFAYPVWWGSMPAILKGFVDRVFLPGFAFKYRKDSPLWDRLLKGRSGQLLLGMDTPRWYYWLAYRNSGHIMVSRTILKFCGIKPVKINTFGPVRGSSAESRAKWLASAKKLGRKA